MKHTHLNIPRGTRLATVWRVLDQYGQVSWEVYTAMADPNAPHKKARGTYLNLSWDGSAARVTDDFNNQAYMEVMPAIGDES